MRGQTNVVIDTEELRKRLEEHAGEHIAEMDLESMREAKKQLDRICFEQENGTIEKACLREATSWLIEKIFDRMTEETA